LSPALLAAALASSLAAPPLDAAALSAASRASLSQRTGEAVQTTYPWVACVGVLPDDALRCEPSVIARITPETCRPADEGAAIVCAPTWCAPCQRVGIEVRLEPAGAGWAVTSAAVIRGLPHGCGFGCSEWE